MIKAEKVFDEVFTTRNFSSSPLNIPSLDGDFYDYELVAFFANVSGDSIVDVTLNSDTTANYRNYEMKGLSSTANAAVGDSDTAIELQNLIGSANPNLLKMNITGSSGDERYINCVYAADGAILKQSSYWKNTANAVDELTLTAASSVTSDAHIMLYRTPKASGQSSWELMEALSWSAETAEKAFSSLLGDSDIEYKISWKGDQELSVQINNDGGANYTRQYLQNSAGTLSANNITTNTSIVTDGIESDIFINAETGVERLCRVTSSNTAAAQQSERNIWYSNTATELTSLDCTPAASSTGTAKLYRKRNPAGMGDTLPFEVIETVDIAGDFSAGHTFSSLLGDSVNLYKVEFLGSAGGTPQPYLHMQFNGDTGYNYVYQYLDAISSTVAAGTNTLPHIVMQRAVDSQADSQIYIYPKSGENRPSLVRSTYDITATGVKQVRFQGEWWINSADEVTSIKVFASQTKTINGKLILSRLVS